MKFTGWPAELYEFYDGLDEDNSRDYFHAHKAMYEQSVRGPMELFLASAQREFGSAHIFRPNRDVRFSKDKRPYKDHCGAVIGENATTGVQYVQVNGHGVLAASGYYMMATDQIARYRAAVHDETTGPELSDILSAARKAGLSIGSVDLKRVPTPYDKDHPRGELLRHKSVTVAREWSQPTWLHSARAATEILKVWRAAAPLGEWLARCVGASETGSTRA